MGRWIVGLVAMSIGTATLLPPRSVGSAVAVYEAQISPIVYDSRPLLLQAIDARARHLNEQERLELVDVVADQARASGLDPFLLLAVIEVESAYHHDARSNKAASGLMQLRYPTAFEVAERHGEMMHPLGLEHVGTNITLGSRYLRWLRDRYGTWPRALAAYNWGPRKMLRARREFGGLPDEMRLYEKRVGRAYQRLLKAAGLWSPRPAAEQLDWSDRRTI